MMFYQDKKNKNKDCDRMLGMARELLMKLSDLAS